MYHYEEEVLHPEFLLLLVFLAGLVFRSDAFGWLCRWLFVPSMLQYCLALLHIKQTASPRMPISTHHDAFFSQPSSHHRNNPTRSAKLSPDQPKL